MQPETKTQIRHLLLLFLAGLGQTILFAFAWGLFGIVWLYGPLRLPPNIASILIVWPSEVTLVVTLVGTVLSLLTTSFFALAFKEALRHRMHSPISFIKLEGGIALARGEFFLTRNIPITLVTLVMFGLTKLMVSSWSTLLTPTFLGKDYPVSGTELDLSSSYFESLLHEQLLATGSATYSNGNSLKIIDTEGLLSGIASAQLQFGVSGAVSFNGVSYHARTGGVVPVAYGYLGIQQVANSTNTGLSFVGGLVPTNMTLTPTHSLNSNYSILQQGLTAQVTCTQVGPPAPVSSLSSSVPISIFNGNASWLTAYSFQMGCNDGTSSQQDYVIRTNEGLPVSPVGLVYSLVCPYPVNQSQQLDWSQFNVTSAGAISNKYSFLQPTTCEITPQFTTSRVTYANSTLFVEVVSSTALNANNGNLSLYLASIIDYQALNAQSLTSNFFGDALYSVAVTSNINLPTSGQMEQAFLDEIEHYWRGVVEFVGTYLRSGFSAAPNNSDIPSDALISYSGTQTTATLGWAPQSPIYLYTVLPMTAFLIATYAATVYVLYELIWKKGYNFTTFDPTNPLHLIMVSSTRALQPEEPGSSEVVPDEKVPVPSVENLEGETLGDFSDIGIQYNHKVNVQLVNLVEDRDRAIRKRFRNLTKEGFAQYKINRGLDTKNAEQGVTLGDDVKTRV